MAPRPKRERRAERLADPQTVVVITGQQAGLFGGPLFTLLKALTAMKLAEQVSREHGVPVVPVFWIDAEDHDWPEVSSCTVLDDDLAPRTITLEGSARRGRAADFADLTLDGQVEDAIAALAAALPAGPNSRRPSSTTSARPIDRAAAWPTPLAAWSNPFSARAVSSSTTRPIRRRSRSRGTCSRTSSRIPARPRSCAARAGQSLVAAGYHAQVTPSDGAVSLFYLNDGRHSVRFSGDRATIGSRETTPVGAARRSGTGARTISARTCCCGRSSRTRCSRRSVTSPDRTSSRIWDSCATSTRISTCRCR